MNGNLPPEGTSEPPSPLRKPTRGAPTRPKGGHCGEEAGRRRHGAAGLGAAHLLISGRRGPQGLTSPATSAAPGPRGERSRCSQWAKRGGNHRQLPPTNSPPSREMPAAGCSSSVTFRESEVQRSRGRVNSFRRPPCGSAPPPGPTPRPRPSLPASDPHGLWALPPLQPTPWVPPLPPASGPVSRLRRRDFRPPGSPKMAAVVGSCSLVGR